jgi:hypothetical protein
MTRDDAVKVLRRGFSQEGAIIQTADKWVDVLADLGLLKLDDAEPSLRDKLECALYETYSYHGAGGPGRTNNGMAGTFFNALERAGLTVVPK